MLLLSPHSRIRMLLLLHRIWMLLVVVRLRRLT